MRSEIDEKLDQLIVHLDGAIMQAVDNPVLFADSPLLYTLGSACASVMELNEQNPVSSQNITADGLAKRETILWDIRARAGRLQMLLDSASQFYSNCFSLSAPEGLAYSVHGEWSAMVNPSHLAVDC
jgi:hypothetical protein